MLPTVLLITQIHRAIGFRQEIASIDAEIENRLTIGIIQPFPSEHLTGYNVPIPQGEGEIYSWKCSHHSG